MKALIDGDILVYRCAAAAQHNNHVVYEDKEPVAEFRYIKDLKEWIGEDKDQYTIETQRIIEPVSHVYYSLNHTIKSIKSALKTNEIEIYLGGSSNFRMEVFPEYKAGRAEKPVHYEAARNFLIDQYDAVVTAGIEADDALGILQGEDTCIVTIDKDLDMVPGLHYDYVKDLQYFIGPEEGELNYWKQMFTGDGVDNIQGLSGIGPVKAEQLVELFWPDVVLLDTYLRMCYEEEDGDDARYERNKKLIRILTEQPEE